MAELNAARRKKISAKNFGLPGERKYPMPDRGHAANAKSRATQMLERGVISSKQHAQIVAKANRVLGRHKPASAGDTDDIKSKTSME